MGWGVLILRIRSVFISALLLLSMDIKNPKRYSFISKVLNIKPWTVHFCIHTIISLSMIICIISSMIYILTSKVDFRSDKFLMQGYRNMMYFFSLWVLGAEFICFGIYSALDMIRIYGEQSEKALKMQNTLKTVASHLLFSLVFPLSVVVMILFWGFYFWNRELIYPKVMDDVFPPFLNHMMHTFPVPVSMLFMLTDVNTEPPKWKTFTLLTVFLIVYSFVFLGVRKIRGEWIYPVFDVLSDSQITWVFTSTFISAFIFFFLGYYVHERIKDIRSYLGTQLKKIEQAGMVKHKIS